MSALSPDPDLSPPDSYRTEILRVKERGYLALQVTISNT